MFIRVIPLLILMSCGRPSGEQLSPRLVPVLKASESSEAITSDGVASVKLGELNGAVEFDDTNFATGQGYTAKLRFWKDSIFGPYTKLEQKVCPFMWMKMEGMEHGSARMVAFFDEETGAYLLRPMFFTMPGSWELHISLVEPDQDCKSYPHDDFIDHTFIQLFAE